MTEHTVPVRLALPMAYADPAFIVCLVEAVSMPEFVANFDRLTGCKVSRIGAGTPIEQMVDRATGFQEEQMRRFAEFVHDSVYLRLTDDAIHSLRVKAILEAEGPERRDEH